MVEPNDRWDRHFLQLCLDHARMSKDPSTKVGAVIVGPNREPISDGFNGFPRGIHDTEVRLNDREMKNRLVVHAEMNAVLNAARMGHATRGTTLYLVATDGKTVWGGPPCTRCTVEAIQAGIEEVVTFAFKDVPSRWADDIAFAKILLIEAGVRYREISN